MTRELVSDERASAGPGGALRAGERRHNLPAHPSSFVGRERETAEVQQLLREARLVTLVGAGGVGKTRLAQQVAGGLLGDFADGIWQVELAALSDPSIVPQVTAAALGLRQESARTPAELLEDHLRPRVALLLLDNCEHLVVACAELAERLLGACPGLRILATSREGLRCAGEQIWRVPPLAVPEPDATIRNPEEFEALSLFFDRAGAVASGLAPTDETIATVAQICRRLDGMPLAIELAVARLSALSVDQLAARLEDRFHLLTGGSRTALPRQQTLRATIDWSYALLSEAERILLRRVAVFAGGWTLEAAEAVCRGDGLEEIQVLDLLTQLVDKSLVLADLRAGQPRYRCLETIRHYAEERLCESGEDPTLRRRHRDWYLELVRSAESKIRGAEQREWLARLESERDNLRAALAWSLADPEGVAAATRLAVGLWWFWFVVGEWTEGRRWLTAALARDESLSLARIRALASTAALANFQGDYEPARLLAEQSLALAREVADDLSVAHALTVLGVTEREQGRFETARPLLEEAAAIFRRLGETWDLANRLDDLGGIAWRQGDYARADELLRESLALTRALGDARCVAMTLGTLGEVARRQGDGERAARLLRESLTLLRGLGDRRRTALDLGDLGMVLSDRRDHLAAAHLFGAAEGLWALLAARPPAARRADYQQAIAAARAALGDEPFDSAWAAGRAMTREQAIDYAVSLGDGGRSPAATGAIATGAGGPAKLLTTREREVAALVARGLQNREIGAELVIGERTVETHVAHILDKLGLTSRTQVAAWAVRQGLPGTDPE